MNLNPDWSSTDKIVIQFFGGDCKEATPVPIPNTEVKLFSADGTARAAVWESRSPPESLYIGPGSRKYPEPGPYFLSSF